MALLFALLAAVMINPYIDQGVSFCLFERIGISFCPGEGLGHSIAYFARGDIYNSLESNLMGVPAIFILSYRICYLINNNFIKA